MNHSVPTVAPMAALMTSVIWSAPSVPDCFSSEDGSRYQQHEGVHCGVRFEVCGEHCPELDDPNNGDDCHECVSCTSPDHA